MAVIERYINANVNQVSHRLRGVFIYMKNSLIHWLIKRFMKLFPQYEAHQKYMKYGFDSE